MPEVFGPYDTEQDTYDTPLWRAWRDLWPGERDYGVESRDLALQHLLAACDAAGVELGAFDRRILTWLAGYEAASVQVVIGLINRTYAAGRALGQTEDCANCGVPGPCQPIGCDAGRHLPGCFWAEVHDEVDPCGTRPARGPQPSQGVQATDPGDLPMGGGGR